MSPFTSDCALWLLRSCLTACSSYLMNFKDWSRMWHHERSKCQVCMLEEDTPLTECSFESQGLLQRRRNRCLLCIHLSNRSIRVGGSGALQSESTHQTYLPCIHVWKTEKPMHPRVRESEDHHHRWTLLCEPSCTMINWFLSQGQALAGKWDSAWQHYTPIVQEV